MSLRIGIDMGGTKIEALALDAAGREVFRKRVATPRGDYAATIAAVSSLVKELGTGSVGVGIPGAMSQVTGLVKNANSTWLNGRALAEDLPRRLGGRPVRFANDANCFALSEASDGAAAGARVAFGVIVGTGTGGGLVVDGRVLTGPNAIAGEWGHNPLPWMTREEHPGPVCYCGRAGCIEQFVAGPALARDQAELGEEEAMARYWDRLARALAHVVNLLDPDVIVIGGGLSSLERLYASVPRLLPRYVYSNEIDTPVVRAAHGDASGVRGAAMLWDRG
jgi:fructokinase